MRINGRMRKILYGVLTVAVVVVFAVMVLTDDLEHIEDTNGPDNFALTTITDQDIIEQKMGYKNLVTSGSALGNTVKISSSQFTGVYEVLWTDVLFTTGLQIRLMDFQVNAGNFKMVALVDGRIAVVVEPGMDTIDLGEVRGNVSLVIAGESADFSFRMSEMEYNNYSHP